MSLGKSLEDYLEAILILQHKNGLVRSIDVAEHMNFSKPSISRAVKELKAKGLLTTDRNNFLHLTNTGQAIAEKIYERHCFFTEYLTKMGVNSKLAESDACKLEHVISDESFQKLKEAILTENEKEEV